MSVFEDSAKQMGDNFSKIPHIVIGGSQKQQKKQDNSPFKAWKQEKNKEYFHNDSLDDKIAKFKKWGLIICVLLIAIYSAYRIISVFI